MWGDGTTKLLKFQSRKSCFRIIANFGNGSPCEGSLLWDTVHIHGTPFYDR
jgi:hypothetical protein